MKTKMLLGIVLMLSLTFSAGLMPLSIGDTLTSSDFRGQSWSKTFDYFNYLRLRAAFAGRPMPANDWHAWTYAAYVNTTGLQLLYFGLQNITFGNAGSLVFPVQTFLMHYKTENTSADVVTASSFLMLLAFNESSNTLFPGSPDINDVLYSSVNIGVDLNTTFGGYPPEFASKTQIFPLTNSSDGTQWSWGMRYTNLTALWFRTFINPNSPTFVNVPVAVTRYDQLEFTYNLTINKDAHRAVLTENHAIGRMSDLWIPLLLSHYNSTGHYGIGLLRNYQFPDNKTIYDFLTEQKIEMSIVQYSTALMINHKTQSTSGSQNVTDNDVDISNSDVLTASETGEKIFDASFGTKKTYSLYTYNTTDHTENTYNNYTAVARTVKIRGFAFNGVIENTLKFVRFVPYVLKDIDDTAYTHGQNLILNVTGANYLYIISYPTYKGFKVVHDPTYTMYYAPSTTTPPSPPNWLAGIIIIVIVIAAIALAVSLVFRRRKPKTQTQNP